jgi:hypothetical protein
MTGESAAAFAPLPPGPPGVLACSGRRVSWRRRADAQWPRCALGRPGPPYAHDRPDEYERFWIEALDRLADYLADLSEEDDTDDDDPPDPG